MRNGFRFYGKQPAMVKNGNLHIPQAVKSFYEVNKDYVGIDEIVGDYKSIIIDPVEEFSRKPDLMITLEKLVLNGKTIGLKLPDEFRTHLGIRSEADVLLVGYGSNFGIWKPKDFEEYESSISGGR